MNQAQIRRLRTWCLPLLAPLLVAGIPAPAFAQGGPATHFKIVGLPPGAFPERPLEFQVIPKDDTDADTSYLGVLRFSSDDPAADLPPDGPLLSSYIVTFRTSGSRTLTVTDLSSGRAATGSAEILVFTNQSRKVVLSGAPANPLPTCASVPLTLTVVDEQGNPVQENATVSLCRPLDRAATVTARSFGVVSQNGECVTGTFFGSAQVSWKSTEREDVPFVIYGAESNGPVTVSWKPVFSPEDSSFTFRDTAEEIPRLSERSAPLILSLYLSDTCRQPLLPPKGESLAFGATPPLAVSSTPNANTPGRWELTLKLPECPADPSRPLAVWPVLEGQELTRPDGGRYERLVQPRCAPKVELAIHSPEDGAAVEPGGLVELEVELSNKSPEPIRNGVLKLAVEGLTPLGARLGGEPLTAKGEGALIPELLPGGTLEIQIAAQATTRLDQPVSARVWYVDADGVELTQRAAVHLTLGGPSVNVGCGCHASSLPGPLWPWLALLLAAARPWKRPWRQ